MSKLLQAYLRQTKRVPETLARFEKNKIIDTEYGIVYPAFRGIEKEEVLKDFEACFSDLKSFLTTFHKNWEIIENTGQGELWTQAILNYFTTYGFESLNIDADGYVYLPDEVSDFPELKRLKIIERISIEEIHDFLKGILYDSNIGLKKQTLYDLLLIAEDSKFDLDINKVTNKEAKTQIAFELGVIPSDTEDVIRILNKVHTGDTMLIKDKEHFLCYKTKPLDKKEKDYLKMILVMRSRQLSEAFYRNKELFLSIRKRGFKKEINFIRNLARNYYKPLPVKEFLSTKIIKGLKVSRESIKEYSISDLVKLYNQLNYFLVWFNTHDGSNITRAFVIRNKKAFVNIKEVNIDSVDFENIENSVLLIKSVIKDKCNKDINIIVDETKELAFPTSEKSFIGDLPLYSSFKTSGANVVGISWDSNDIDLSALLETGCKIGWNSNYKTNDKSVLYSGDMTRAVCTNKGCSNYLKQNGQESGICPECGKSLWASEAIYFDNDNSALIVSNLFNKQTSVVNIYLAKIDREKFKVADSYNRKFIVDPNEILYTTKINQESKQETLGLFTKKGEENTFTFANLGIGSSNVSYGNEVISEFIDVLKVRSESSLKISDIFDVYTQEEWNNMLDEVEQEYEDNSESVIEELENNSINLIEPNKLEILKLVFGE